MLPYLWISLGSALGGVLRYTLARLTINGSNIFPWCTVLINVIGSFVIGFFGTLTLRGSRYEATQNVRLFVMVGLCGGFTTFSSFSLETFDLFRAGAWYRALINIGLSVTLCLGAVAMGHYAAQRSTGTTNDAIAVTSEEEFTGYAIAVTSEEEFTG